MKNTIENIPQKNKSTSEMEDFLDSMHTQIKEDGGSEALQLEWRALQENLKSGNIGETLIFLEGLDLKKPENLAGWRNTVYELSKQNAPSSSGAPRSIEKTTSDMAGEFLLRTNEIGIASLEHKAEIMEEEIRRLRHDHGFLKNSIDALEQKQKKSGLSGKEEKMLKEDQELARNTLGKLKKYRIMRDSLYLKLFENQKK